MKDNPSWLTPKQAGELSGYTTRHIQNFITSGKLSATREDGRYYIDKAEFFRVFPKAHAKENNTETANGAADLARIKSEMEVEFLKEKMREKDKMIEFLLKEHENSQFKENKMLDAINSHSRLLEHKESQLVEKRKEEPATKKSLLDRFKKK